MLNLIIALCVAQTPVTVAFPEDGLTYTSYDLFVKVYIDNENQLPDSVRFSLNGAPAEVIAFCNTDWCTYMSNDCHTGYSESSAPSTSDILWTAPITGTVHEFATPAIVNGVVFHPSEEQETLYALDALTGTELWSFPIGGYIDDAVTVKNDRVYVASDSIWCLDSVTGDKIWAAGNPVTGDNCGFTGTPVVADGKVYVTWHDGTGSNYWATVMALSDTDGSVIWESEFTDYSMQCCPALHASTLIVPFVGTNAPLLGLNASTGDTEWTFYPGGLGFWDSSPCISGDTLFIGSMDSKAYAINATSGEVIWEKSMGTPFTNYIATTPALHDGNLMLGASEDAMYCLDSSDGSETWSYTSLTHGSEAIADGIVFWGDKDGKVIAADELSGSEVWSYQTASGSNGIVGSPSLTNGIMYIAATDGFLYAFGSGLIYTFKDEIVAQEGYNELIAVGFDDGVEIGADTVSFNVDTQGIEQGESIRSPLSISHNPFSSACSIIISLTEPAHVAVDVYDLAGRHVGGVGRQLFPSGEHHLSWGTSLPIDPYTPSGIYIVSAKVGERTYTDRVTLLR